MSFSLSFAFSKPIRDPGVDRLQEPLTHTAWNDKAWTERLEPPPEGFGKRAVAVRSGKKSSIGSTTKGTVDLPLFLSVSSAEGNAAGNADRAHAQSFECQHKDKAGPPDPQTERGHVSLESPLLSSLSSSPASHPAALGPSPWLAKGERRAFATEPASFCLMPGCPRLQPRGFMGKAAEGEDRTGLRSASPQAGAAVCMG